MSESGKRTLSGMSSDLDNPKQKAAETIAEEIIERAQANEILKIIDELIASAEKMEPASRYKQDRTLSANPPAIYTSGEMISPMLKGLKEPEAKREALLMKLHALKNGVITNVTNLREIILEIEATKTEG